MALATGANSITAQYSGDSTFTSSTSPANTVTVGLATTTTAVTFSPSTPVFGSKRHVDGDDHVNEHRLGLTDRDGYVPEGSTTLGTGTVTNGVATLHYQHSPGR